VQVAGESFNLRHGIAQGCAGFEVEGEGDRRKLAGVVDRQRPDTLGEFGHRV